MGQRQVIPKTWYIHSGILTLAAIVLTQISLFDVLGYESSFAIGLGAAISSWLWGLEQERRGGTLTATLISTLALFIGPLSVLSLNAFFVQNCSFIDGAIFFVSIPVSSALYSATLAYTVATLSTTCGMTRAQRRTVLVLVFVAPLVAEAHQFLTEPTIFFFNHAWGWYAGSIYDEGLVPDIRLAYFRLGTWLRLTALFASLFFLRRYTPRAAVVFALVTIGVTWFLEARLGSFGGYQTDREQIEEVLSERVELEGLVIHLDPSISTTRRQAIVIEHAFRLKSLAALQKSTNAQSPIHSYVYRDAEQKGALMGGKRTMFAKPWLREIHIHGYRTPHRILGHELVHALLESHADHPLGIPVAYYIIPMMGWVEGFAEAFTPPRSAYDIHTYARWLQQRDRLPRLEPLLSPWTFWRTAPNVAYPVMGSFIDFLLKSYDERVLDAYRDGNIERALGNSVVELEEKWLDFLDNIQLDEVTQRGAANRLRKPSLFDRPCARVIAALREEAQETDEELAPQLYKKICDLLPGDATALFEHARSLAEADRWKEFEAVVTRLDENQELGASQLGRLFSLQGERAWKQGKLLKAKAYFERALNLHTGDASARLRWVSLQILTSELSPQLSQKWYLYLFEKLPWDASLQLFKDSSVAGLSSPMISYLHGRRLYGNKAWGSSAALLEQYKLDEPFMEAERLRLLREAYFEMEDLERADALQQEYLAILGTSGQRARADDAWQSRMFAKRYNSLTAH